MDYQKLFNYMSDEHGVTLLEQDMREIIYIVNEIQSEQSRKADVSGSFIDDKWNEYRSITNNEDAWSFKEWLKSNGR